jgi:hypothetical protein
LAPGRRGSTWREEGTVGNKEIGARAGKTCDALRCGMGDGYIMGGSVVMKKRGLITRTYNGVKANLFYHKIGIATGRTHDTKGSSGIENGTKTRYLMFTRNCEVSACSNHSPNAIITHNSHESITPSIIKSTKNPLQ